MKLSGRVAARRPRTFLPRPTAGVVLLEPFKLAPGTDASALSRMTPCTRTEAAEHLGSGEALHALIDGGAVRELPASCTPEQFRGLFADVAIVSRNGVAVASHGNGIVELVAPAGGTTRVSTALYEVLRRSTTGTVPMPTVIDRVAPKWGGTDPIIAEVITRLRALLASGAVVLVRVG